MSIFINSLFIKSTRYHDAQVIRDKLHLFIHEHRIYENQSYEEAIKEIEISVGFINGFTLLCGQKAVELLIDSFRFENPRFTFVKNLFPDSEMMALVARTDANWYSIGHFKNGEFVRKKNIDRGTVIIDEGDLLEEERAVYEKYGIVENIRAHDDFKTGKYDAEITQNIARSFLGPETDLKTLILNPNVRTKKLRVIDTLEERRMYFDHYLDLEKIGFHRRPPHPSIQSFNDDEYIEYAKTQNSITTYLQFSIIQGRFYSCTAAVSFDEVENILMRVLVAHNILEESRFYRMPYSTIQLFTSGPTDKIITDLIFLDVKIYTEKGIEYTSEVLRDYFNKRILPLSDEVMDILALSKKIEDVPNTELKNHLEGPKITLKKLIILKLANSPKYSEFKKTLEEAYSGFELERKMLADLLSILE